MATQTREIARHGDDGAGTPLVVFSYDYDDTTLRVTMFRCVNNSSLRAWGRAELADGTRSQEAFFGPGTTTIPVPTGAAQRLQLVLRPPKNSLDGVSFATAWPA